jgi:hypothetical protein
MGKAKYKGKDVEVLLISDHHNFALISDQPDKSKAYKVDLSDMSGMESILEEIQRKKLEQQMHKTQE